MRRTSTRRTIAARAAIGVAVAALAVPVLQAVEPTVIIGPIANLITEGSQSHNGATEGSLAAPDNLATEGSLAPPATR